MSKRRSKRRKDLRTRSELDAIIVQVASRDIPGLSPAGNDDTIQFNNDGVLGSVATLTFDDTDLKLAENSKLRFGDSTRASIESNGNGGITLSGSTVQISGTLEGASPLKLGGAIEMVPDSEGTSPSMKFGDDVKLFLGDDSDSHIFYDNSSNNYLEISSSANGIVLSGSAVYVDQKLGIGMPIGDVTHGITLPDVADNSGKVKANAYMTYSSQRFKKDVEVIDNPIKTIQNLRGVTFTWKKNDQKDYGFIAEEVGKELPIIVEWDRNNSENSPQAMSMDYTRIIPILLEGIKFQQNQIDNLIDEIKCLKQGTEQN